MSIAFAWGMRWFAVWEHMALSALKTKMNPTETIMKVVKHWMKWAEAWAINFIENDIIPFTFEWWETKEWTVWKYMKALWLVYAYSYVNKKWWKINDRLEQIEQKWWKILWAKIKELIVKEEGSFNIVLWLPNNKSVILNQNWQEIDREGNVIPKENVVLYWANNQPLKQEAKEPWVLFDQYGKVIPVTENKKPEHKNHEDPAKHPLEPEVRVNLLKLALKDEKIFTSFREWIKSGNLEEKLDRHMLKERLEEIVNKENHGHKKIEITEHQVEKLYLKLEEIKEIVVKSNNLQQELEKLLKDENITPKNTKEYNNIIRDIIELGVEIRESLLKPNEKTFRD